MDEQSEALERMRRPALEPKRFQELLFGEGPWPLEPQQEPWPNEAARPRDEKPDGFETSEDLRIPKGKRFFKIGEVARVVGVEPYVLRYWEESFRRVRPEKTRSGQRRYRRQDVALLLTIRRLRHENALTIAQTRKVIEARHQKQTRGPAKGAPKGAAEARGPRLSKSDAEKLGAELAQMRQVLEALLRTVQD